MINKLRSIKEAVAHKTAIRLDCEQSIAVTRLAAKKVIMMHTKKIGEATRLYSRKIKEILPLHEEIFFLKNGIITSGFVLDYGSKNNICVITEKNGEVWVTISMILDALDKMESEGHDTHTK